MAKSSCDVKVADPTAFSEVTRQQLQEWDCCVPKGFPFTIAGEIPAKFYVGTWHKIDNPDGTYVEIATGDTDQKINSAFCAFFDAILTKVEEG